MRRFPAGGLALLAALALPGCHREAPRVTDYDRSIVVRAGDLAAFGWTTRDAAAHEKFTKRVGWDGTYRLEYEFETPDAEVDHPLYLGVFVSVERTAPEAILTQNAERIGMEYGLRGKDVTPRVVEDFYPGATFEILDAGGVPVGNAFSARRGRKVYTLLLSGLYFDDPVEWKALVDDKLRRLEAGAPAPAVPGNQ